jgi:hypothetical protein
MIFTFGRRLALIANPDLVPRSTAEVLQFGKTVTEDTGMSGYQKREAASAYCFGPTSVRQFGDIVIACASAQQVLEAGYGNFEGWTFARASGPLYKR